MDPKWLNHFLKTKSELYKKIIFYFAQQKLLLNLLKLIISSKASPASISLIFSSERFRNS